MSGCFVIAEAGVNHNGSLDMALELVSAAARAGADAVKFQTFRAEDLVTKEAPQAEYQKIALGNVGGSQLEMLRKLELSPKAHSEVEAKARSLGIEFLSTPFDSDSLDFLVKEMKVRRLKIGSGDLTNGPLLARAALSGLPVIISTGMANMKEILEAVRLLCFVRANPNVAPTRSAVHRFPHKFGDGREWIQVLHCVTEYPAPDQDLNLKAMLSIREQTGLNVGYSDHSTGPLASLAAVAMGAKVIEKHFTLDRNSQGPDHRASMEEMEFHSMVKDIRRIEVMLGAPEKVATPSEKKNLSVARRSLVTLSKVEKGEEFSADSLGVKRPGTGISPMDYWDWIGRRAERAFAKDEVIR